MGVPHRVLDAEVGHGVKNAFDENWKLSRRYGVTGVPTFVVGNRGVVGAQPYEVLEQLMERGRAEES